MELRPYQIHAANQALTAIKDGILSPCIVLPPGAGKSHVIAKIAQQIAMKGDFRVMMLTHVQELVEQNAEKLRLHWPRVELGIFSAGLKSFQYEQQVIYGSIQSAANHINLFGKIDALIVDEAHLINPNAEGQYNNVINELRSKNERLIIIGFTATPERLGHGVITTGKKPIFEKLYESVTPFDLIKQGYLCPLISRKPENVVSTEGVKKSYGDFQQKDLARAIDLPLSTKAICKEIVVTADRFNYKTVLVFAVNVEHAGHICSYIQEITDDHCELLTGDKKKTSDIKRKRIIKDFKNFRLRFLVNVGVATTGLDVPNIDFIALVRPTQSYALYMQMIGRGLRVHEGKAHTLILDFAGNVERHGPITEYKKYEDWKRPSKRGETPVKTCPECNEIVGLSKRVCPGILYDGIECGFVFPIEKKETEFRLSRADIMGHKPIEQDWTVFNLNFTMQKSKKGKDMLVATYKTRMRPIREYFVIGSSLAINKSKAFRENINVETSIDNYEVLRDTIVRSGPSALSYVSPVGTLGRLTECPVKIRTKINKAGYPEIIKRWYEGDDLNE